MLPMHAARMSCEVCRHCRRRVCAFCTYVCRFCYHFSVFFFVVVYDLVERYEFSQLMCEFLTNVQFLKSLAFHINQASGIEVYVMKINEIMVFHWHILIGMNVSLRIGRLIRLLTDQQFKITEIHFVEHKFTGKMKFNNCECCTFSV